MTAFEQAWSLLKSMSDKQIRQSQAAKILQDKYGQDIFRLLSPNHGKFRDEYHYLIDLLQGGMSPEMASQQTYTAPESSVSSDEDERDLV